VTVVAAIGGALFGVVHLIAGVQVPGASTAERRSGSHGAVPLQARYLRLMFGAAATIGSLSNALRPLRLKFVPKTYRAATVSSVSGRSRRRRARPRWTQAQIHAESTNPRR
jgi:hypothetical protein